MSRCWSEFALRVPGPSTRREGVYRPRYSIGRERFTRTINVKTRREANEELQNILGNKSKHIAPTNGSTCSSAIQKAASASAVSSIRGPSSEQLCAVDPEDRRQGRRVHRRNVQEDGLDDTVGPGLALRSESSSSVLLAPCRKYLI